MGRILGNRFGDNVDVNPTGQTAPSAVYSMTDQYFMRRANSWDFETVSATGGTTYTPGNGYKYHVFSNTGATETFVITNPNPAAPLNNVEILMIAGGGGGGGGYYSGGGGAGGVIHGHSIAIPSGTYPVVVGAGGAGGPGVAGGTAGGDTAFNSITAIGGGRGGSYYSGGAAPTTATTPQPVPANYSAYGNTSVWTPGSGCGGGGAGALGSPPTGDARQGGAGIAITSGFDYPIIGMSPLEPYSPTNNQYGGGGSGGMPGSVVPGGDGGGGPGTGSGLGGAAIDKLGGGGGGSGNPLGDGGDGGDGMVVIRYQSA